MENILLSHKIEFKNPIESKYLPCILKSPNDSFLLKIWVYNLETKGSKFYGNLRYIKIFNLPNNEILLIKLNLLYKKELVFQFLHSGIRREIYNDLPIFSAAYCDGYLYLFGNDTWKIKILDIQKNNRRKIKFKKMPSIENFGYMEFLSYAGFFDKMLITGSNRSDIYMYDRVVNSWSELGLILNNGHKILAVYKLKIYVILFPGNVYENQGDLKLWNVITLNTCRINTLNITTYTYNSGFLIIADNKSFYSFDLNKIKFEKIDIIMKEKKKKIKVKNNSSSLK